MALDVSSGRLIDPRSGVPIQWATSKVAKEWWFGMRNTVAMELLPPEVVERTIGHVQEAMALYPADLLKEHLKAIFLAAKLNTTGRLGGLLGLAWHGAIYISNRRPRVNERLEIHRIFHHELAHVLQKGPLKGAFLFDWIGERDKPGFLFRKALSGPTPKGLADDGTSLWKDGFLRQIGRTDPFEDYCHYAEGLFMGDPEFWKLVDEYPPIRRKAGLMIEFYSRLDPHFSLSFFEGLRR